MYVDVDKANALIAEHRDAVKTIESEGENSENSKILARTEKDLFEALTGI